MNEPAPDGVPVVEADPDLGLDAAAVDLRRRAGLSNDVPSPTSRTYREILRANIVTPFNIVLGSLLVAILAVREYRDALFGIVLVLNAAIGIIQESRSKRTLDRLTLLSAPHARVVREGRPTEVTNPEVVRDDIVLLAPGDQVTVDGTVVHGTGLEIDESLLTGEADPVPKHTGDEVLSGSFVAAGSGTIRATAVGESSYAFRLGEDARRFTLVKSELRDGINTIIKVATWFLVPTGVLLIISQLRSGEGLVESVQGSVAGMVAMIPEGLVLLTSTALAVSVVRLGRKQVLTQELAAIEGLARVDTICLDKTGTLTEGHLSLGEVDVVGSTSEPVREVLGAMVGADPNPNPSLAAIGAGVSERPGWEVTSVVPFSSARKWSAASFAGHGTWLLGAPDVLMAADGVDAHEAADQVTELAAEGRRVILLASSPHEVTDEVLPEGIEPVALTVLDETIRPEAPDTISYFGEQHVAVKIISGDSPVTVGAVARRVGVPDADDPVDARDLPEDLTELAERLDDGAVFGRVTPQQKRDMVHALQSRGHEVAMTGDGVNDTLALKDAEIGVAMGSGSPAARAVARFVLLDNSFAVFPSVVAEGRKVIANVERVANLFLTKTFYAMVLSLAVGVAGLPFPFLPRHLTLISSLTIGIPGFFLALAPNARRARPGFLGRVLRFALPAGIVAGVATLVGYQIGRLNDQSLDQDRTTAVIVMFLVAFWVLGILARPFNTWRVGLVGSMAGLFFLALTIPVARDYFELVLPDLQVLIEAVVVAGVACGVLELSWHAAKWVDRQRLDDGDDPEESLAPVLVPQAIQVDPSRLRDLGRLPGFGRGGTDPDDGPDGTEDGPATDPGVSGPSAGGAP